jgi:hypothetical protein
VATQLTVIRGDKLETQTVNLTSSVDDFTDLVCTGQLRPHPDGDLIYQFVPTVEYAAPTSGSVFFSIPGSDTKSFPPINLYGDIHFTCTGDSSSGIYNQTLFEFRLDVQADVTHL